MSTADVETQNLNFIQNFLVKLILQHNDDMRGSEVKECAAKSSSQFDGFMSSLYFLDLKLKNNEGIKSTFKMVVKIMKGEERIESELNAAALTLNELFIYKTVIPQFRKFLIDTKSSITDACAVPRAYFVDYKIIEELGNSEEAVLVMDNLMDQKYRAGPKFLHDDTHLRLMVENIAKFHSISYAMRIKKKALLEELVDGLVPYSFLASDGSELEVYNLYYKSALERLFNCILNDKKLCGKNDFIEKIKKMKRAAFDHPLIFMETLLAKDDAFCAILHGDYDQTNVLFKYESEEGYESPQDIRMIDFQETRFASPIIDLAPFLYINMTASMRVCIWDKMLEYYHQTIIKCLCDILTCERDDPQLEPFSYKNFLDHFRKNAFFGVMVAISSLPMLMSSEDESQRMTDLYDDNYESAELQKLSLVCGGKDVDEKIKGIILHAFEKGYLDIFNNHT